MYRVSAAGSRRDHLGMEKYFDARVRQARWAVRRWAAFPVRVMASLGTSAMA
jgi:hypothetical protein